MTEYHIPTADIMENDTGTNIRVIEVGSPTNGETLLGSVSLSATTVIYTPPNNATANTDCFGYTITDDFGQTAQANVYLALTTTNANAVSFVGPYQVTGLQGFTNGEGDLYLEINPFGDVADASFYGTDVFVVGIVTVRNGNPINLTPGWTLGTSRPQGNFTAYEIKRTFAIADWISLYNTNRRIRIIDGSGFTNGDPPPTDIWFDLDGYTCPGASAADLFEFMDIRTFGPGPQVAHFENYGTGIVYTATIHCFMNTDAIDGAQPIASTPANLFFGFQNDFETSVAGYNDQTTASPVSLDGTQFQGQDMAVSVARTFRARYR